MKRTIVISLTICFIMAFFYNIFVFANEKKVTLKVGLPIQDGVTEIDNNGTYSGYTYEYLMKISQYTG